MPPKRKRKDETPSDSESQSESESDVVSLSRPTATALLPELMQNIERLKSRRDRLRKTITKEFDAYAAGKKNDIGARYASKAEQRSSEAKDLLTRYAVALERRASIEKSIEGLVLNAREDVRELAIVLEAAYSGRRQQTNAAIGSFASPTLASAKGAAPTAVTTSGLSAKQSAFGTQGEYRIDGDEKEARAGNSVSDSNTQPQFGRPRGNFFDRILW
ncbi:hypothetical protein GGR50DRAFT_698420 [Xylaria sp. CBS 124048]|nr:hypothetical protein GGR50DRAFT_698420 [Xylaria sp. CBS 124048]